MDKIEMISVRKCATKNVRSFVHSLRPLMTFVRLP